MYSILLIEELFDVRESVRDYFSLYGKDRFRLDISYDFWDGMNKVHSNQYDIVIVDIKFSGQTGSDFCKTLRQFCPYPVMFIIDMDNMEEVSYAAEMCAAALIIKPFTASDVYEQVNEYLEERSKQYNKHTLKCSGIIMNSRTGLVTVDGKQVNITGKASALLCVLLENANSVVSREYLLKRIWGEDFSGRDRVVDGQIKSLRKQLGDRGNLIRTEKGEGYMIGEKH